MRTRTWLRTVAVVGALVLPIGTPAWGAKPDDRGRGPGAAAVDRSEEPGGSGVQGKSPSDPDGTENGGADKPGGDGGVDTTDQDGNNGCGNDADFEDDNRGRCLGRQGDPEPASEPEQDDDAGEVTAPARPGERLSDDVMVASSALEHASRATVTEPAAGPVAAAVRAFQSPGGDSESARASVLGERLVAEPSGLRTVAPVDGGGVVGAGDGERVRGLGELALTGLGLSLFMVAGGLALLTARTLRQRLTT